LQNAEMWFFRSVIAITRRDKFNKKFLEEFIPYIPFTAIWVPHTSRKKTFVCTCNEINKTIQFGRLQCWYYWWEWFMKYKLRLSQMMWYTYQVLWRLIRAFRQY
jgi:hypothetical protein